MIRRAAAALGLVASYAAWATSGTAGGAAAPRAESSPRTLTVCADPNNLPFSNSAEKGFENQISRLIARDLHANLEYVWWAQRRGYARNTLSEGKCDLWPALLAARRD